MHLTLAVVSLANALADSTQRRSIRTVSTIGLAVSVKNVTYCSQSSNAQPQYISCSLHRTLPALNSKLVKRRTERIHSTLASSIINLCLVQST
jgi:hypothetical protein